MKNINWSVIIILILIVIIFTLLIYIVYNNFQYAEKINATELSIEPTPTIAEKINITYPFSSDISDETVYKITTENNKISPFFYSEFSLNNKPCTLSCFLKEESISKYNHSYSSTNADGWEIDYLFKGILEIYLNDTKVGERPINYLDYPFVPNPLVLKGIDNKEYLALFITEADSPFWFEEILIIGNNNKIIGDYTLDTSVVDYSYKGESLDYEINDNNIIIYKPFNNGINLGKYKIELNNNEIIETRLDSYFYEELDAAGQS
jgi:hypothetical protein